MVAKPVIFISSTSDLRIARELVGKVLYSMGYEPVWQEIEATDGGELLEVLRKRIAPSAMMIQLVGQRYGAEPPTPTPEFGRVSYTQYEALYAEKLGRKVVYHFIDSTFPLEASPIESEVCESLQAAYQQRIKDANKLRQMNIASAQDLELSIRRICDELAEVRKQSDARFHKMLQLVGAAVAGVILLAVLVMGSFYLVHRKQSEQTAKSADQLRQLERIEKILVAQKQANPQAAQVLSAEDQAILDEAKQHGNLKSRANASVLSPDANTDALLAQLKAKHSEEEFELAMLEGKRWYFDKASQYDQAIPFFEQAMALRPDSIEARSLAADSHVFASRGDMAAHQNRAIQISQVTLELVPPKSADWAKAQNTLGIAWAKMPTGDRAKNLTKAIGSFESALSVRTKDADAVDWAGTQINLGVAWESMPTGNLGENLHKAMEAYEAALRVFTKEIHPVEWAMTQNDLGSAWVTMPTGDRNENLRKAIAAYEDALSVYRVDAFPADWAMTQNNLGNAWHNMLSGDRGDNLHKAIAAYEAALTIYRPDVRPVDWAMTENNLGNAWADMPIGDLAENLRKAVTVYEAALTIRTRDAHPVDWAQTQNNLGNAWYHMPGRDQSEHLRKAIAAYEASLSVRTKDAYPVDWAQTQNNLGNAWGDLPTGDRRENLHKAIAAYESALTVRTHDTDPVKWAQTRYNLAIELADLSSLPGEDRCERLRQAIACEKGALQVYTPQAYPSQNANTWDNLQIDRLAYEFAGCADSFDSIPPAK